MNSNEISISWSTSAKGRYWSGWWSAAKPSAPWLRPRQAPRAFFEITYKANGKPSIWSSRRKRPLYRAAALHYRKLKVLLRRLEKLSQTILRQQAKLTQSQQVGIASGDLTKTIDEEVRVSEDWTAPNWEPIVLLYDALMQTCKYGARANLWMCICPSKLTDANQPKRN
jgi:hypothetical protein